MFVKRENEGELKEAEEERKKDEDCSSVIAS